MNWDMIRPTAYDFAQTIKANGFIFSSDTIKGKSVRSSISVLIQKADLILETLIREVSLNCDFIQFLQSEIACACALITRKCLGIDEGNPNVPSPIDDLFFFSSDGIKDLEYLISKSYPYIIESAL
jgi:hypothetical protein